MFKKLFFAGFIVYAGLLLFSIIFYKERTVFIDIAFLLFNILRHGTLEIQGYRFGSAITEAVPLAGRNLGWGLKSIMMAYSTAFILYYSICYSICGYVFKNYKAALVVLFLNILFVTDSFYWMQSEMPQGIAFMCVLFAWMEKVKDRHIKPWAYLLFIPAVVTAIFFHPLLFIPFFFILLHLRLSGGKVAYLIVAALTTIASVLLKNFYFVTAYDAAKLKLSERLMNLTAELNYTYLLAIPVLIALAIFIYRTYKRKNYTLLTGIAATTALFFIVGCYYILSTNPAIRQNEKVDNLLNIHRLEATRYFLAGCIRHFYWIPVLSLMTIACYIRTRAFLKLAVFVCFNAAYVLLLIMAYPGGADHFYMENLYLPLSLMIGIPFIFDVLPSLVQYKAAVPALVCAVGLTGLIRIYNHHQPFTDRLQWQEAFLEKHKDEKLIIASSHMPMDTLFMSWGTPYEFWLLSTMKYKKSASIMVTDNIETYNVTKYNRKDFIASMQTESYEVLHPPYFIFTDTLTHYELIK